MGEEIKQLFNMVPVLPNATSFASNNPINSSKLPSTKTTTATTFNMHTNRLIDNSNNSNFKYLFSFVNQQIPNDQHKTNNNILFPSQTISSSEKCMLTDDDIQLFSQQSNDESRKQEILSSAQNLSEPVNNLESKDTNVMKPFSILFKNLTNNNIQNITPTELITIPNSNDNNNISKCLKSFLNEQTNIQQQQNSKNGTDLINDSNNGDIICSSLSSSSSSDSQFLLPSTLNDIETETITFEHTEDFIKSLQIPLDVLDDLASRFVLNMPQEEKYDPIRICFQVENAFWHYLDFCCKCNSKLPKFKFKRFAQIMFTYVPRLRQFLGVFDDIITKWIQYKFSIPCSGAIMLDESMDYILLVQGYGSKTWGFPKGKVNHDESLMNCAVREVFEETGYNCVDNIFETQYLERKIFESRLRLYLIKNVDFNFDFKPQARNEIRSIKWFALKDFPYQPDQKKAMMTPNGNGDVVMQQNISKFVSVMPFINSIRKLVENEKRKSKAAKKRERRQKRIALQMKEKLQNEQSETQLIMNNFQDSNDIINQMGSNSSSPSTIEDENTHVVEDSEDQVNQSTSFVDVDLNAILGYREIYNAKNDERELKEREKTDIDQKNWDTLVSDLKNKFTLNGVTISNDSPASLPQAGTLEDIERAMINSVVDDNHKKINNNYSIQDINSVLGSKGSCNEKLNLLFGLAQNHQQQKTESSIHQNGHMISNGLSVNETTEKPIKPMAPIGTKRSPINKPKQRDNHEKLSGQTVISNDTTMMINTSKNNNNPLLNGLFDSNGDQTFLLSQEISPKKNCSSHVETDIENSSCRKDSTIIYNGLEAETLSTIHPKIELLLQRLKIINNMA